MIVTVIAAITDWVDRHHTRDATLTYRDGRWSATALEAGVYGTATDAITAERAWHLARADLERQQAESLRALGALLRRDPALYTPAPGTRDAADGGSTPPDTERTDHDA